MKVETYGGTGIPYLCLDRLIVDHERSGGKLDTDRGFGFQVELVPSESTQQVGFTDTRVTNQHH